MKRLTFFVLIMTVLFFTSLTNAEDQYEVHMQDGKIIKGAIIINHSGARFINVKGYNSADGFPISIPCPDIEYIQRIHTDNTDQLPQSKSNTTVKGDDIVFRDFLWSDTPQITKNKINDIDGYNELMGTATTINLKGINQVDLKKNIIELDRVFKELKGCNSESIIQYQSDVDPTKDSVVSGINFFFSIHDDSLLYYFLYIQRDARGTVTEILDKKYGNGENVVRDWIKWENDRVILLYSSNKGRIIYVNYNNLKTIPLQCREADKNKQSELKGNATKQF